jgi:hypothetical protein
MKKNKTRKGYLYFHNGNMYDNIILLDNLDSKLFKLHKMMKKGNSY